MSSIDTTNITNGSASDEVLRLQQRISELEQQVAAHAATSERLGRVEVELELFRVLVESAIDGVSFATPDRIVQYANRAFGAMSGYDEQCVGKQMSDFIPTELRAAAQQEVGQTIRDTGQWQGPSW
jgi:PAS domain-containing protein